MIKPGTWRRIFLGLVILSASICIFSAWMAYRITPSILAYLLLPIIVTAVVLGLEIFSVLMFGKTLSANVTKALEQYKKARVWIWLSLISLVMVLVFLVPHLVITG